LGQIRDQRQESYGMGFKDATEYLVGQRFRTDVDSGVSRPVRAETEEQKELRIGIEKLVKDYEEKVERKQFKFRLEDHKFKEYEKSLINETTDSDILRERLERHRNDIVDSSIKSYQAAALLALDCVVNNMDLDKQNLLVNLDASFKNERPSFLKEVKIEIEAKTASLQRQLAAHKEAPVEAALAAHTKAMENLQHYREEAYDLGFKDAAEFLYAQWQSLHIYPEEDPEQPDQTTASPGQQNKRYAKELNFYKKENERLRARCEKLQTKNDELEAALRIINV